MSQVMLDTNIFASLQRDPRGPVAQALSKLNQSQLCTSVIVASEIRYGLAKNPSPRITRAMEALLSSVEIHPLAASASQHYAVLRADLEKRGRLIGSNDLLIAAHCLDLGAALATLNKAEFKRVKSLALYPL